MSKTNCVNCGAAKDIDEIKCPFCGTTYLDMTGIDFTKHEPVVCKFVLPYANKPVLSMLAFPRLEELSMQYNNSIEITSLEDNTRRFVPGPPDINVGISFVPVATNKEIFRISVNGGDEDEP